MIIDNVEIKVGAEVGIFRSGWRSWSTGNIAKVAKINRYGHIILDNGLVFDKHGQERAVKKAFSGKRVLVNPNLVREEIERLKRRSQINEAVGEIQTIIRNTYNSYRGEYTFTEEQKQKMVQLINSL